MKHNDSTLSCFSQEFCTQLQEIDPVNVDVLCKPVPCHALACPVRLFVCLDALSVVLDASVLRFVSDTSLDHVFGINTVKFTTVSDTSLIVLALCDVITDTASYRCCYHVFPSLPCEHFCEPSPEVHLPLWRRVIGQPILWRLRGTFGKDDRYRYHDALGLWEGWINLAQFTKSTWINDD